MRLLRWIGAALTGVIGLACALLLTVRYVALPQVESRRAEIAHYLSGQLGHPVEIDAIATGWDGWNPEVSVHGLRVRDRAGASVVPLLDLPVVTGVVSWTSLPLARLQFKALEIERARLAVRRDTAGRVHLAGFEFDPETAADDRSFVDWLLRQRQIVVRDALVAWNDDLRNAPQLVLDRVQLRIEHAFGRHRLGLRGTPPPEIASPIDVRAEFATASLQDWQRASGELYVRLDYADVAAWSEWLPLPMPVDSGKGALRTWFGFDNGAMARIVADVELEDVRTRLAPDLPHLEVAHVAGRVAWKGAAGSRELEARALTVAPRGAPPLRPLDFKLVYRVAADGTTTGGDARASDFDVAAIAAAAAQLPLPPDVREQLARFSPQGTLHGATFEWTGPIAAPRTYRARGEVRDLGVRIQGNGPAVSGITGVVDANERGGTLRTDSRGVAFALPAVFAQPIPLDRFAGEASWERDASGATTIRGTVTEISNADAAGIATFAWTSKARGPGMIDLDAKVQRVDARRLERYLPQTMSPEARAWIARAIRQGEGSDGRVVLKGDLAEFPFANARSGRFQVAARVQRATLDYAEGWPPLADVDADVRVDGSRLSVVVGNASVLGVAIGRTTVEIADMRAPRLRIEGTANGPTSGFLAFVARSPVAQWTERATDGLEASGSGRLALSLELDLVGHANEVAGEYRFLGNQLRIRGAPALANLTGALRFDGQGTRANDLTFDVLGGPALGTFAVGNGRLTLSASGNAKLASVRAEYPSPWLDRVDGSADWRLALDGRGDAAHWVVESTLRGTVVDLPRPAGKAADATLPLRVERRAGAAGSGRDQLRIDYGSIARVVAERRIRDGEATVDRALVLVGQSMQRGGEPERAGVAVRGDVEAIDADDWIALLQGAPAAAAAPELASVELRAKTFDVLGRAFHDMTLGARRTAGTWRLTLAAQEVEGTATWEPGSVRHANGRVSARLSRLSVPGAGEVPAWHSTPHAAPVRAEGATNPWPEIDLASDRYLGKRGDLGRLELLAKPAGADWRIEKLSLSNPAGSLTGEGVWRASGGDPQTRLDVSLDVKDTAAYLARFGLPDAVRGAPTKIEGQLAWNGGPDEFDYATLAGAFKVAVGPGQFTKIEPGIGKLLGVLSLQALPRRITLDFRDVFSEGFAFDAIDGNVRIGNGIMHTENLRLVGPAANVLITGDVDLRQETQRLAVRVQPSLATSVSAGAGAAAMLLLAANPVVAAAVGAGTLLAQKVMKDPIEQMFSYEYSVRGSWDEPLVDRVTRKLETSADAGKPAAPVK